MLTPIRSVIIILLVGLCLNIWLLFNEKPTAKAKPEEVSTAQASPSSPQETTTPTPQGSQTAQAAVTRETIAERAFEQALGFCEQQTLPKGLSKKACVAFAKEFRGKCLSKHLQTMPATYAHYSLATADAEAIVRCVLPPIVLEPQKQDSDKQASDAATTTPP